MLDVESACHCAPQAPLTAYKSGSVASPEPPAETPISAASLFAFMNRCLMGEPTCCLRASVRVCSAVSGHPRLRCLLLLQPATCGTVLRCHCRCPRRQRRTTKTRSSWESPPLQTSQDGRVPCHHHFPCFTNSQSRSCTRIHAHSCSLSLSLSLSLHLLFWSSLPMVVLLAEHAGGLLCVEVMLVVLAMLSLQGDEEVRCKEGKAHRQEECSIQESEEQRSGR
jgi:hypothetical protein